MRIFLGRFQFLLSYLLPVIVVVSVLLPEWWHYYIPGAHVESDVVARLRQEPKADLFEQLASMPLLNVPVEDRAELMAAAQRLLSGAPLQLKAFPEVRVTAPLHPADLDDGPLTWQLFFSGLRLPALLLEAYRVSGREEYFDLAREDILAWARHERGAWWPRGFLWNDHALAARAQVLADFWSVYRAHPRFDAADAGLLLGFVVRTGRMLAKPSHFTFATNHGVMQNLALMHIALAFPALPQSAEFREIARTRLARQMEFYINDEGVVLEHSAGYHRFGLELIGFAFRYLSWFGEKIPEPWLAKYERAKRFYAQLRRPDGSLPLFGNTTATPESADPGPGIAVTDDRGSIVWRERSEWVPKIDRAFYPLAGYAVWWDGLAGWPNAERLAQTVVVWSHFPGHGHKLADELSVLYWAGGRDWWTNIGYWPYGDQARKQAISWEGSSAPHAVDEARDSQRIARANFVGGDERFAAIDLERTSAEGYRVRRQVISMQGGVTVVIDVANDPGARRTRSVWRTNPTIRMEQGSMPGVYRLTAGRDTLVARFFGGDKSLDARLVREGIPGKVVLEQGPTSTSAIVVEHPSDGSWAATAWFLGATDPTKDVAGAPTMQQWQDAEHWKLDLPAASRTLRLDRGGRTLRLFDGQSLVSELALGRVQDVEPQRARILEAFEATSRSYGIYRDLGAYRLRAAYALIGLFVVQILVLRIIGRYYPHDTLARALRPFALVSWIVLGLWLHLVYFGG